MNTVIVAAGGMGGFGGLWQTGNYYMGGGLAIGILACLPVLAVIYLGKSTRCVPLRVQLAHWWLRLRDSFSSSDARGNLGNRPGVALMWSILRFSRRRRSTLALPVSSCLKGRTMSLRAETTRKPTKANDQTWEKGAHVMPDQVGSAGRTSPLPPAGWYPDPQGSSQRYWDGTRWTEQRMPAKPTPKRVRWWLVILCLIAVLVWFELFSGFTNVGNKLFRGSPSAPAPAAPGATTPGSSTPAAPAPPGSSSHTAGSVRIIIDGQEKSVQGAPWCATRQDGKFAIGINNVFGVVITPGTPLVVDSVVFSQGPPPNPQDGIAGWGMEFNANGPAPGQASAVKNRNSYTIKGTAADAAHSYQTTRPFEIDAICPT